MIFTDCLDGIAGKTLISSKGGKLSLKQSDQALGDLGVRERVLADVDTATVATPFSASVATVASMSGTIQPRMV